MMPKTGSTGTLLSKLTAKAGSGKDQAFCHTPNSDKDKITGRALIIAYLIFIIILSLSDIVSSFAQAPQKGLQVGDTIPGKFWHLPLQVAGHPQNKTSLTLNDYRGKLIILDFWATWCSPCVAMMPRIDSLQKAFDGQVQFLPVTYQKEAEVLPFMEKLQKQKGHRYDLPELTGDTVLHKLFPHRVLPHYVWIDVQGCVRAISEPQDVTAANIAKLLNGGSFSLREKQDVPLVVYDQQLPLFINGNGGNGKGILYHSLLSSFQEGLGLGGIIKTDSLTGKRISLTNQNRAQLFQLAFSENGKVFNKLNTLFQVKDPLRFTCKKRGLEYLDWLRQDNGFCYELLVPPASDPRAFAMMRQDLERFFPEYCAAVKKMPQACYVLVSTDEKRSLQSGGGKHEVSFQFGYRLRNAYLGELVYQLNYMQRTGKLIIDESGFTKPVDLVTANALPDIKNLNDELQKYGLKFLEEERDMEMLVISDRHTN